MAKKSKTTGLLQAQYCWREKRFEPLFFIGCDELAISEDALILVCLAIGSTIFTKLDLGTMELVNKKEVRGFVRVPLTSSLPMRTPFHQDGCPRLTMGTL